MSHHHKDATVVHPTSLKAHSQCDEILNGCSHNASDSPQFVVELLTTVSRAPPSSCPP